jgi:hypothetical protein
MDKCPYQKKSVKRYYNNIVTEKLICFAIRNISFKLQDFGTLLLKKNRSHRLKSLTISRSSAGISFILDRKSQVVYTYALRPAF